MVKISKNYIVYSIQQSWLHYAQLVEYHNNSALHIESVLNLDPSRLMVQGIQILVLDFDGVLASHGKHVVDVAIGNWLKLALKVFGANRVFILSNRIDNIRKEYLSTNFPTLGYVVAPKKPYPDGLLQISASTGINKKDILIIDDRLTTGVLSAIIAGTKALWVTKPLQDWSLKYCLVESFFAILRRMEKIIF